MRKLIAAINMTVDSVCDHTAVNPDDEIHQYYAELLRNAGTILYGRITFQLMEYWKTIVENPTGNKAMDDFALIMNSVPKIVFSNSLKNIEWESAKLANRSIEEEAIALKKQSGKDIYIGSRSLIIQLMKLNLIDEYQLCVHPVIAGSGSQLFKDFNNRKSLQLIKTKTFSSGAVMLYYEPTSENL